MGEKEGEESYPEINDTTIAETGAVLPEETTSSSDVEGQQFHDLPYPAPGEVENSEMAVRRRKAKRSIKKRPKKGKKCPKKGKKCATKGKKRAKKRAKKRM